MLDAPCNPLTPKPAACVTPSRCPTANGRPTRWPAPASAETESNHDDQASRTRRLYLVLHDTENLTRHCPRMMTLLGRYAHAIQINRTHEEIREIQDAFLVLDAQHYVRRPAASFFRGAMGLGDETEGLAMRSRFMEIWGASFPGVSSTTVGL